LFFFLPAPFFFSNHHPSSPLATLYQLHPDGESLTLKLSLPLAPRLTSNELHRRRNYRWCFGVFLVAAPSIVLELMFLLFHPSNEVCFCFAYSCFIRFPLAMSGMVRIALHNATTSSLTFHHFFSFSGEEIWCQSFPEIPHRGVAIFLLPSLLPCFLRHFFEAHLSRTFSLFSEDLKNFWR